MKDLIVHSIEDISPYAGEHAIPGIRFRALREAMSISSWGMNLLDLDPHCDGYPEHDHKNDEQEELYLILEGQVTFIADGNSRVLSAGQMVRVEPTVTRKFVTKEHSVRILALGGTPGRAYGSDSS